jgi:magnesium transporter
MSMLPQLRTRAPHLRTPRPPRRPLAVAPAASDHVVDCAIYVDGRRRSGHCTPADISSMRPAGDGFVWLGLHDPDEAELTELAERFDLHPLAVEDALHAEHQRPSGAAGQGPVARVRAGDRPSTGVARAQLAPPLNAARTSFSRCS